MHNDLYQFLKTEQALVDVFGGRIYHMSAPNTVQSFPLLTFQRVTRNEFGADWEAPNDAKLQTAVYQFDIIASGSQEVIGAAEAFDAIFVNFRGTMGATSVQDVVLNGESHLEQRDGDKLRRRISLDYAITYVA